MVTTGDFYMLFDFCGIMDIDAVWQKDGRMCVDSLGFLCIKGCGDVDNINFTVNHFLQIQWLPRL